LHRPDAKKIVDGADDANLALDGLDEVSQEDTKFEGESHPPVATSYDPATGRRLLVLSGTIAAILAVAFFMVHHIKSRDQAFLATATAARAEQPPPVNVVKVQFAPPRQVLTLPGETRGWYSSTIFARVNGFLAKWFNDIGDRVKSGQVLATIDTPELDAQLEAAQAQVNASEAEVKVKEADAEFAKTTYERWQGSPKGVVSEQERQDKKARFDAAVAALNAAQARVKLDKANVDRLTHLTEFKQVTAPFDGVITERRVDIGDLVTAGSTTNTSPLFGIAQVDKIRVFVNVPQSASVQLGVGSSAQVTASEHPTRTFEGKVTRTSESIDPRARTLRVEVDLSNSDLALLPGMYVKVAFSLKPTTFLQVPASALLFRASGPQVAVITDDDKVKFKDVTIARDNGHLVEIASGLAEGDRVALNINNQIANGERVTIMEEGGGEIPTASK
jgi:RND family efflux transporter MFP subunit